MNNKVFISCAVTGSGDTASKHPDLPKTPEQIAKASIEAAKAGAAIAHIHVREEDGTPSRRLELYKEVVDSTAINIHGTIHNKVPHAKCIFHVHSKYATALSTLKDPTLPPIDQNTMRFYNRVSVYNEYGGMGFEEESKKMATALGNKKHMLMANHGIMTTGETVSDGFDALYYFEKSAETYLTALSTNKELNIASHEVAEKTAQEWATYPSDLARAHLDQIRVILDKEDPDYKN